MLKETPHLPEQNEVGLRLDTVPQRKWVSHQARIGGFTPDMQAIVHTTAHKTNPDNAAEARTSRCVALCTSHVIAAYTFTQRVSGPARGNAICYQFQT